MSHSDDPSSGATVEKAEACLCDVQGRQLLLVDRQDGGVVAGQVPRLDPVAAWGNLSAAASERRRRPESNGARSDLARHRGGRQLPGDWTLPASAGVQHSSGSK
jgi:hypothetical protein